MAESSPNQAQQPAGDTVHHKSARQKRVIGGGGMQLNLTSMIDVIFQLLIYFVITANFAVGEGIITAKLPAADEGSAAAPPPETPLNVVLTASGQYHCRIMIEGTSHSPRNFTELADLLARMQYGPSNPGGAYKDDNPLMIKPEGTVRWQHVVNAFNAAVKAKYKNVSFAKAGGGTER
jgi:biopolymer transport protein ExbD